MIQIISFAGADQNSQVACNKASKQANLFMEQHGITRTNLVQITTQYQTLFSVELGGGWSECVMTLVVDLEECLEGLLVGEAPEPLPFLADEDRWP